MTFLGMRSAMTLNGILSPNEVDAYFMVGSMAADRLIVTIKHIWWANYVLIRVTAEFSLEKSLYATSHLCKVRTTSICYLQQQMRSIGHCKMRDIGFDTPTDRQTDRQTGGSQYPASTLQTGK